MYHLYFYRDVITSSVALLGFLGTCVGTFPPTSDAHGHWDSLQHQR